MEALILYFVLFFPGTFAAGRAVPVEVISFSAVRELGRLLTHSIPSLALLWYLINGKKGFFFGKPERLRSGDVLSFIIGLPGLVAIGFGVSLLAGAFNCAGLPLPPRVEGPANAAGWIVVVFSCLATGYLEESYFRYYLLSRFEAVSGTLPRAAFAAFLFAFCHVYEGPWGVLNAVLAGIFLSLLFVRSRSLHGIAWAHGTYNLFVYIIEVVAKLQFLQQLP